MKFMSTLIRTILERIPLVQDQHLVPKDWQLSQDGLEQMEREPLLENLQELQRILLVLLLYKICSVMSFRIKMSTLDGLGGQVDLSGELICLILNLVLPLMLH